MRDHANGRRLWSVEDLAEYLQIPVGTIYRWNYAGTGPRPIPMGRHVRYKPEDVDAWLEAQAAERSV